MMMSMRSSTLSLLRQSLKNDHQIQLRSCRGMTILSKESGEEFKKQVSRKSNSKIRRRFYVHGDGSMASRIVGSKFFFNMCLFF